MTKKETYPGIKLTFPKNTDTEMIKKNLANTAQELGYVATYHKSVTRGSIGLLLIAIANGDAKVTKSED